MCSCFLSQEPFVGTGAPRIPLGPQRARLGPAAPGGGHGRRSSGPCTRSQEVTLHPGKVTAQDMSKTSSPNLQRCSVVSAGLLAAGRLLSPPACPEEAPRVPPPACPPLGDS